MHVVKWQVSGETVTFIGDMELSLITVCTEQYCHLRGKVPKAVRLLDCKLDFRLSSRSRLELRSSGLLPNTLEECSSHLDSICLFASGYQQH
jgi:hypothetical protein